MLALERNLKTSRLEVLMQKKNALILIVTVFNFPSFSASLMIFEVVLRAFCINKVGSIAFCLILVMNWCVCVWVYNYRRTHT